MSAVYVAISPTQQEWGSDVGISQHLYKVGVADGSDEAAAKVAVNALNESLHAGQSDWQLLAFKDVPVEDEGEFITKLAEKQTMIDPTYYPKLKGVRGIFKINVKSVEASLLVQNALAGKAPKVPKLKPKDLAAHLLTSIV